MASGLGRASCCFSKLLSAYSLEGWDSDTSCDCSSGRMTILSTLPTVRAGTKAAPRLGTLAMLALLPRPLSPQQPACLALDSVSVSLEWAGQGRDKSRVIR